MGIQQSFSSRWGTAARHDAIHQIACTTASRSASPASPYIFPVRADVLEPFPGMSSLRRPSRLAALSFTCEPGSSDRPLEESEQRKGYVKVGASDSIPPIRGWRRHVAMAVTEVATGSGGAPGREPGLARDFFLFYMDLCLAR
jgi:hypothetical protein